MARHPGAGGYPASGAAGPLRSAFCRSAADGGIRHQRSSKHPAEIKPEELEIDWLEHGGDRHLPARHRHPAVRLQERRVVQRRNAAPTLRPHAEEPHPGATTPGRARGDYLTRQPPTFRSPRPRPPSAQLERLPAAEVQGGSKAACPRDVADCRRGPSPLRRTTTIRCSPSLEPARGARPPRAAQAAQRLGLLPRRVAPTVRKPLLGRRVVRSLEEDVHGRSAAASDRLSLRAA